MNDDAYTAWLAKNLPFLQSERGSGVLGNSGLYRRHDEGSEEPLEDYYRRVYEFSQAGGAYGTGGRNAEDLFNSGFVNLQAPVTIDGQQWHQTGENIQDPAWMKKFLTGLKPDAQHYTSQWDLNQIARDDPTYGFLMREPEYQEAMRLNDAAKSDGWMAQNSAFEAFSSTIGRAMGLSSLLAGGLGLAAGAGSTIGEGAATWAGNALSNSGYQSLWSSLAQNAAGQGGSWSDISNFFTGNPGMPAPPPSYWSMMANLDPSVAGGVTGATGTDAQQFTTNSGIPWGDIYEQYGKAIGGVGAVGTGGAALSGGAAGGIPSSTGGAVNSISDVISPDVMRLISSIAGPLASGISGTLASNTAAGGYNKATDTAAGIWNAGQANVAPWLAGGKNALAALQGFLGIGPDGMTNPNAPGVAPFTYNMSGPFADPGYKFRLDQGLDAVMNKSSAMGGTLSGNTLKAINDYAGGSASQEYQGAYDRWRGYTGDIFNRLNSMSGTGANAGLGIAGIGQQAAANIGSGQIGAAQYNAASQQNIGNSAASLIQNLFRNPGGAASVPGIPGGGYGGDIGSLAGESMMFDGASFVPII